MNLGITPTLMPKAYNTPNYTKKNDVSFGKSCCIVLAKNDSILNRAILLIQGFLANNNKDIQILPQKGVFFNTLLLKSGTSEKFTNVFEQILENLLLRNIFFPLTDKELINIMEQMK